MVEGKARFLAINLAPVANANNQDADQLVFDAGDDAVVTDSVLPKVAQVRALQSLTNAARVLKTRDSLEEKLINSSSDLRIEGL